MTNLFTKLKNNFQSLSNDYKLIIYFSLIIFIQWIVFDYLKFNWMNDPFQKIIFAPLGEEPFKLILALFFCYIIWIFSNKLKLSNIFIYNFVYLSLIIGIIFGYNEGAMGNIFLHASTSSIGAIFITFIYLKIKDKTWKNGYKLIVMYVPITIPLFIHSLGNQFTNISYANSHPEFNYLVILGRFLVNNNIIISGFLYCQFIIIIAIILIVIWYSYLFYRRKNIL